MQPPIRIPVRRLPHSEGLSLPAYATPDSAGVDLLAAVDAPLTLQPMERALVPTGIAMALPEAYEAQIRPRSGLAYKSGITVANAPGTIDADYRGEIKAILINLGQGPFTIERGMRIAQMVVAPVARLEWAVSDSLPENQHRGDGGFGSTGLHGGNKPEAA